MPSSSDQPLPNNLASQKPLSTSQGSLKSIPDNDSNATLSADETPGSHGDRPSQQPYPGSIAVTAMPGSQGLGGHISYITFFLMNIHKMHLQETIFAISAFATMF